MKRKNLQKNMKDISSGTKWRNSSTLYTSFSCSLYLDYVGETEVLAVIPWIPMNVFSVASTHWILFWRYPMNPGIWKWKAWGS